MGFLVSILILSIIYFSCGTYITKAVLVKKSLVISGKLIAVIKMKKLLIDEKNW